MRHRLPACCIAVLALVAPSAPAADDARRLAELVDGYFEEHLALNPVVATWIGDHRYDHLLTVPGRGYLDAMRALNRRAQDALRGIDRGALGADELLTWEVFEYGRRVALEAYAYPVHLLPLEQMNNRASFFAQMGSGQGIQPFRTEDDYDNFAARMAAFPAWTDQVIAAMREGIAREIVEPRLVMERVLPQLATHAAGKAEASVFWQPVAAMPESFDPAVRKAIESSYRRLIEDSVIPSYARLRDFVRDEYLPKSRATIGLGDLAGDGQQWYAFLARGYTTTDMTVAAIHDAGLREVARLDGEIAGIMGRIGFRGSVAELADSMRADPRFRYGTPEELVDACRGLQARVNAAVPRLFTLMPRTPLEIRRMEAFLEQSKATAEYYSPAGDGSRPGIFSVNTYDLASRPSYSVEALYLHEAIPGHHFQIALAIENANLPRFRRFGLEDALRHSPDTTTAFAEGWGLYAESLGEELGLYGDPYRKLGSLFFESWRAVRLVVDTGMHARGWSREQAIDYMLAHTALGRTDAVAEVERYIAWPGQALAYKIGQMKIRELRERAARELGAKFDVREFHARVLEGGAVPLAVLEAKIGRWIGETK